MNNSPIETALIALLTDMTRDWGLTLTRPIDLNTPLVADLGFASVDFMQLIASLEKTFHVKRLPYEQLLMRDSAYVSELTLGEIAAFLTRHGVQSPGP